MAFNNWPYTDFHEFNLDWVIKTVKDLSKEVVGLSDIINNKLDGMVNNYISENLDRLLLNASYDEDFRTIKLYPVTTAESDHIYKPETITVRGILGA